MPCGYVKHDTKQLKAYLRILAESYNSSHLHITIIFFFANALDACSYTSGLYSFSSDKSDKIFPLGFFLERTKQVRQMLSEVKSDSKAKHLCLHCLTEIGKDHMLI